MRFTRVFPGLSGLRASARRPASFLFLRGVLVALAFAFPAAWAQIDVGDGSDGPYVVATGNTVTLAAGNYNFSSFVIESGATVEVTGNIPLYIRSQQAAQIDGTLTVSGGNGIDGGNNSPAGAGGSGVAGGAAGGHGGGASWGPYEPVDGSGLGGGIAGLTTVSGPWIGGGGGGYGTAGGNAEFLSSPQGEGGPVYGDAELTTFQGGSGGGGGGGDDDGGGTGDDGAGGGGAGGGAVRIAAPSISVGPTGSIRADGGNGGNNGNGAGGGGGSGGAIWLQAAQGSIQNDGVISALGGAPGAGSDLGGVGGDGRIRMDYFMLSGAGTIEPAVGANLFTGPLAIDDDVTIDEDAGAVTIDVLANDIPPDSGTLAIDSVVQPANATVAIVSGGSSLTYEPNADYCNDGLGTDDFEYTESPGSTSAVVSVTVQCVNDPPSFVALGDVTGFEDTPVDVQWVTSFSPGPPNESSQAVGFVVDAVTNPGLFQSGPAVDATGRLTFVPAADTVGSSEFTVTAFDDGGTANGGSNQSAGQTYTVEIQAAADLALAKTGPDTAIAGRQASYTISLANLGPSDALAVVIADPSPVGYTFAAADAPCGNGFPCELGTIAASTDTVINVTYNIDPATIGAVVNTATASSTTTDANTANNAASITTTVTAEGDLSITKTDNETLIEPGDPVTYTIVAANAGPSLVPDAQVTDTFELPLRDCSWTSIAAGGAFGNTSGNGDINEIVNLPPDATMTYTVVCGTMLMPGPVTNSASIGSATVTDPDGTNNTATDDDTVIGEVRPVPMLGNWALWLMLALVMTLGIVKMRASA